MRTKRLLVLLMIAASTLAQPKPKTAALEGLDPVLLTEGKETPGKEALAVQHGAYLYQFSSEETRSRFQKDPEKYAIQMDGACARMGAPVRGLADSYYVYDRKIYIFGSNDCYKAFSADPAKYVADAHAAPAWKPTAAERAQGRALLKKAIAAMGGEAHWNAVRSYVRIHHVSRPQGDNTITDVARMPESFRAETVFPQGSYGNLITPAAQFTFFREEGQALPKTFSEAIADTWRHDLLPILLSRDAKEFDVAFAGRLIVNFHGSISTLLLDPASGRVAGIEWRGRSPNGFSDFRINYSDYRETDGVQLPYAQEGTADGHPHPNQTWKVDNYQLNPPDIDARLKPPAKIREL